MRRGYLEQVELLVQALSAVATEPCFALKGGTAINLFVRNLPRLSVDIDLVYLPIEPYQESLAHARDALHRLALHTERIVPGASTQVATNRPDQLRILVTRGTIQIKVEVSPVLRGSVHPPEIRDVQPGVEERFGFASVPVLAESELFAGKICAALDRQHPRDLFDIMLLDSIDAQLFSDFLVYLISHNRPMAELLSPNRLPLQPVYDRDFLGMTEQPVSIEELEQAREDLIVALGSHFDDDAKSFLLSIKQGQPRWDLLVDPRIADLPAVRWKLRNLATLSEKKHQQAVATLQRVLEVL